MLRLFTGRGEVDILAASVRLDMHSQFVARRSTAKMSDDSPPTSEQFNRLQELFEKTFKAARVGIWECSLPDETLTWTDTVFELFDLDPRSPLRRDDIVALYTPASRKDLGRIRSAAIDEGEGFTLDAEIVTAKGNRRWIRITALVERADGREGDVRPYPSADGNRSDDRPCVSRQV